MKLKCDVCDNLTSNPLVDKDENGKPIIVCQNCFARVRAMREYLKQPKVPEHRVKPSTKINGNRYATITSLKQYNKYKHKLEMYENNILLETLYFDDLSQAYDRQAQFINFLPVSLIPIRRNQSYRIPHAKKKGSHKKMEYIVRYNNQKYKAIAFKLSREKDVDLLVDMEASANKTEFLRQMYAFWKTHGEGNE